MGCKGKIAYDVLVLVLMVDYFQWVRPRRISILEQARKPKLAFVWPNSTAALARTDRCDLRPIHFSTIGTVSLGRNWY